MRDAAVLDGFGDAALHGVLPVLDALGGGGGDRNGESRYGKCYESVHGYFPFVRFLNPRFLPLAKGRCHPPLAMLWTRHSSGRIRRIGGIARIRRGK
jgi:hypothetical protein